MTVAFVGEIRWLATTRAAPFGWLECNGAICPTAVYDTLFMVIGTTYGGNGKNTFALPDLRGRVPIHQGAGISQTPYALGEMDGSEGVSLAIEQAGHTHVIVATAADAMVSKSPGADAPVTVAVVPPGDTLYCSGTGTSRSAKLGQSSIAKTGNNEPHPNCAPTTVLRAFICFDGVFPSQN
jgi:microcystin-dependent protein